MPATPFEPNRSQFIENIGRTMANADKPDLALEKTLETIRQALHAEAASIFLYDPDTAEMECQASIGPNPVTGIRVPKGKGIVGQVAESRQPILLRNAADHPGFYQEADRQTGYVTRSMLCAPLIARRKVLGVVSLLNCTTADGMFTEADQSLLVGYCALAALSINNAQLAAVVLERECLRHELELARDIQRSMLPQLSDGRIQGANLAARYVSGDFFGHVTSLAGDDWFCLGDVSGKGINAALWMVRALSVFSCLAGNALSPAHLLQAMNREMRSGATRGMFITLVVGAVEASGRHARIANAGHLPVLVCRADGISEIAASGPPIGILDAVQYDNTECLSGPATLCVISDGVAETIEGKSFQSLDKVKRLIGRQLAAGTFSPTGLITLLSPSGAPLDDDATVLAVQLLGEPTLPEPLLSLELPAHADQLRPMREAVRSALAQTDIDDFLLHQITLAINEACMNVIQHACCDTQKIMQLNLYLADRLLTVHLLDNGKPIAGCQLKPRDFEDLRPGGLGVHFMREIMDEVDLIPPPPGFGNLLRMTKRLE